MLRHCGRGHAGSPARPNPGVPRRLWGARGGSSSRPGSGSRGWLGVRGFLSTGHGRGVEPLGAEGLALCGPSLCREADVFASGSLGFPACRTGHPSAHVAAFREGSGS